MSDDPDLRSMYDPAALHFPVDLVTATGSAYASSDAVGAVTRAVERLDREQTEDTLAVWRAVRVLAWVAALQLAGIVALTVGLVLR